MNKSLRIIGFTLFAATLMASCGSKYNKIKFKDPNEGNTEIYSEGTEPNHIAHPSPADPAVKEIAKQAIPAFRERVEQSVQK